MPNAIRIMAPQDVHLEALSYKYPMRNAVTLQAEIRQIEQCIAKGYAKLWPQPLRTEWLSVVGYGPSLVDTWHDISHPIITVSGAHDFLIERGVIPDWHAECDGRDHKTKHLEHPHKDVVYLMASICHPKMWEQLEGCKVLTWHNANGQHVVEWIAAVDDGSILVAGGSNVGLSAIHLAGILGFRKFRLYAFDGNLLADRRHAGPHYGPAQKIVERVADCKTWRTTPQMSNACDELLRLKRISQDIEIEVVGDSLMKALVS